MKKIVSLVSILFAISISIVSAKDYVIVVKDTTSSPVSSSEIKPDPSGQSDTIQVSPEKRALLFTICIKTLDSKILYSQMVPNISGVLLDIESSKYPDAYILEITDEKGRICSIYEL